MNTERLNTIAKAIVKDFQVTRLDTSLQELVTQLQNQVNNPGHPPFQQAVSDTVETIYNALEGAPSNDFPPTWVQAIEEFNVEGILGKKLKQRIEEIFFRNQITPSVALADITSIKEEFNEINASFAQILSGFSNLKIGEVELAPDNCEIGVLLPREFVKNEFGEFGKEINEINQIFNTFAEISTGSRPGFKIREISSSELTIFLDAVPQVGVCLAVALERLIASYQRILDIKLKYNELKKLEVPDETLKALKDHSNNSMKEEIDKLVPQLLDRFYTGKDKGRRYELEMHLKNDLSKLANRIDNGFNIEIRVVPQTYNADEKPEDVQGKVKVLREIESKSKFLSFINTEGPPILSLPESTEEEIPKDKKTKKAK